jgi:hypothetical protein
MRRSFVSFFCAAVLAAAFPEIMEATGVYAPARWLDNGGIASDMSPELYWELELKRMAREFAPREKRVLPPAARAELGQDAPAADEAVKNLTGQVESADFADAIKTGRIKPPDPEKAKAAHQTSRDLLTGEKEGAAELPPEEFPSEFADYHRGAFAFRRGAAHYEEARAAWEALLKRPEGERHYRTAWAAFMLGKLALAMKDPSAVKWFRQTRELARGGFADSLGLAADSYGWEARSELKQQHFEAAAKLYLTQLALGDESAIVSLKAVVPDRPSVEGMVNFGAAAPENASDEEIKKWEQSQAPLVQKRLDECARSQVLRHLVTAHVLATESQETLWRYGSEGDEEGPKAGARCLRWLATLEKAGLGRLDDADHLGWVAYTAGRYEEAARWLAMARPDTPTALWLSAKLERRAGQFAEAAASMAAAFKAIRADVIPFGNSEFSYGERGYGPDQSAAGDLAALHLTRGEFVNAMELFLQGELWDDAAFVGDRVLTVDELKKYVDAHFPQPTAEPKEGEDVDSPYRDRRPEPSDDATRMRWMLARRLVREHRFDEARAYFRKKERATLDRYTAALQDAENSKLPKPQRARALFTAAWIARHDGMEIMGAEEEPDGFVSDGAFPPGHADVERAEGVRVRTEFDEKKQLDVTRKTPARLSIPATAGEKQRIVGQAPQPEKRFHYRWVAAELAWRAAGWMSDGSEELADVLNTGGSWIKDADDKGVDKFIQAIERRCPHTKIGIAEAIKHWFVDQHGPWSKALEKEAAAAQPDPGKPQ